MYVCPAICMKQKQKQLYVKFKLDQGKQWIDFWQFVQGFLNEVHFIFIV